MSNRAKYRQMRERWYREQEMVQVEADLVLLQDLRNHGFIERRHEKSGHCRRELTRPAPMTAQGAGADAGLMNGTMTTPSPPGT